MKTITDIISKIEYEEKNVIICEISRKRRKKKRKSSKGTARNRNIAMMSATMISLSSEFTDFHAKRYGDCGEASNNIHSTKRHDPTRAKTYHKPIYLSYLPNIFDIPNK